MRVTLPESQRTRKPGAEGTVASIVVHAVMLGGALVATARSAPLPERPPERVVYTAAPRPDPVVAQSALIPTATPTTVTVPEIPRTSLPTDVTVDLPVISSPLLGSTPGAWTNALLPLAGGEVPAALPAISQPFDAALVERAAEPRSGNPIPRYPDLLRSAGVEGSVVIRFVVDTLGAVEPGSVAVLRSTHPLFEQSVREAVRRMRFRPAEFQGRRVRQLVEQEFGFVRRGE